MNGEPSNYGTFSTHTDAGERRAQTRQLRRRFSPPLAARGVRVRAHLRPRRRRGRRPGHPVVRSPAATDVEQPAQLVEDFVGVDADLGCGTAFGRAWRQKCGRCWRGDVMRNLRGRPRTGTMGRRHPGRLMREQSREHEEELPVPQLLLAGCLAPPGLARLRTGGTERRVVLWP
jgi:hypothetical protein